MHPQILIPIGFAIFLGGGVAGFVLKTRLITAEQKVSGAMQQSARKAADKLEGIGRKL